MTNQTEKGTLTKLNDSVFLQDENGTRHFESDKIWDGYVHHWLDQKVCGRYLPQKDYETNSPIIILWPDEPPASVPFVEFYYNESLVKYIASTFGHNAINVNGEIFNFSHLINENEVIAKEEYFYRPALGEFAPSPNNDMFEILEDGRAYYDKFGRNFMRTIHVIRIEGIDTDKLSAIYHDELDVIHNCEPSKKNPEKYKDFHFLTRSCSTIIRDGLKRYGFSKVSGIFPFDLFVNIAYTLQDVPELNVRIFKMPQLTVPEAPLSRMTPLLNLKNRFRVRLIRCEN